MTRQEIYRLYQNKRTRYLVVICVLFVCLVALWLHFEPSNQAYLEQLAVRKDMVQNDQIQDRMNAPHAHLFLQEQQNAQHERLITEALENEERKASISLFSGSQSKEQIAENIEHYQRMLDRGYEITPTLWMEGILQSPIFSIAILLLAIVLGYHFFLSDRVSGVHPLLQLCRQMKTRGIYARIRAYLTVLMLLPLIYICVVLILGAVEGVAFFGPLQWLPSYYDAHSTSTILSAWLGTIALQTLAAILIALIVVVLALRFQSIGIAVTATGLLLALQFFLYAFIPMQHQWAMLKVWNVYYLLFGGLTFQGRWNVMGTSIPASYGPMLLLLLLIAVLFALLIYSSRRQDRHVGHSISRDRKQAQAVRTRSLLQHEASRFLLRNKGAVVLLLVFGIVVLRYVTFDVSKSEQQLEREKLEATYYGPITEERMQELSQIVERARTAYERISTSSIDALNAISDQELEALSREASTYGSYMQLQQKLQERIDAGISIFVEEEGYRYLFGDRSTLNTALNVLMITAGIAIIGAVDVQSTYSRRLQVLFDTTVGGIKKRRRWDFLLYYGFLVVLHFLVLFGFIWRIQKGYPVLATNDSLATLGLGSSGIPVYSFIALVALAGILLYAALLEVTIWLSKRFDVVVTVAIVLGSVVLSLLLWTIVPVASPISLMTPNLVDNPFFSAICSLILIATVFFLHRSNAKPISR